jgi:hypothetical protein
VKWFVFGPFSASGPLFTCDDDTEGEEKVIKFLTEDFGEYTGYSPEEAIVIRGEQKKFVLPKIKGTLV